MIRTSTRKFALVFSIISIAELIIMYLIGHERQDTFAETLKVMLLDSFSLSLIVAPALYFILVKPLENSLRKIKVLKGLMSVCCVCKKVKTGDNDEPEHWIGIDKYIQENSEILFSHGYCPECHKKTLEKVEEFVKKNPSGRSGKSPSTPPTP